MLSVLVPARNWPLERIEACVASYAAFPATLVSEIIVVDFGSDAPITLPDATRHRVRVVRLEAKRWSLAEATNAAVLAASNDVVAKTDADILISADSLEGLERSVRKIQTGQFDILLTQDVNLPESLSLGDAQAALASGEYPEGRLRPRWGQGSLTFFSRAVWARVGGYDSRFTGWGEEDNDFCNRARRSGARLGWVPPEAIHAFHVWHPPTYHQTHVARERIANGHLVRKDKSVFRPLRFLNSDISPLATPSVLRTMHPLVTVALATYMRPQRERMIGECIRSFSGQIGGDFETVIVDNGSSDESFHALRKSLNKLGSVGPIRLERQVEASIPRARNEISRIARGRFICVIDDDDMAFPNRLADHLKSFESDGLAHGSQGGWIDYDEESGLIEKNSGKVRTIATMLKGTGKSTNHPSSFYRTDVMQAVPYDESMQLGSDWDMALRMAALGLKITNTNSYVTLRRFHASNVTLTGSSDQVRTGLRARSRVWGLYNARHQGALIEDARANDAEFVSSNDFSIADLLDYMPAYAGLWRLAIPFAVLARRTEEGEANQLEALLDIVDGDVTTLSAGIAPKIQFCSKPIRGARRARKMMSDVAKLVGVVPTVISDRQLGIDRSAHFDWSNIALPENGAMVISARLSSAADALQAIGLLTPGSLLQSTIRVVSDFDDNGEAYYLIAPPTDSRVDAQEMIEALTSRTGIGFRFARSPSQPAVPTATIVDRFH